MDWLLEFKATLQAITLGAIVLASFRWGGSPERSSALTLAWIWLGDIAYHALVEPSTSWLTVDLGHLLIDLIACVALTAIALAANRIYPLWLAALQTISLLMHMVRAADADAAPLAYAILNIAPSYLLMLTLALGIWLHHRRTKRFGPIKSWRASKPIR